MSGGSFFSTESESNPGLHVVRDQLTCRNFPQWNMKEPKKSPVYLFQCFAAPHPTPPTLTGNLLPCGLLLGKPPGNRKKKPPKTRRTAAPRTSDEKRATTAGARLQAGDIWAQALHRLRRALQAWGRQRRKRTPPPPESPRMDRGRGPPKKHRKNELPLRNTKKNVPNLQGLGGDTVIPGPLKRVIP